MTLIKYCIPGDVGELGANMVIICAGTIAILSAIVADV